MFHLFAGDWYYPAGGVDDYVGGFTTIEDARDWGEDFDWAQIAHVVGDRLVKVEERSRDDTPGQNWWHAAEKEGVAV